MNDCWVTVYLRRYDVWQRAANVATKTVGILDPPLAITVTSEVDSEMPPDLPKTPNFQDEDGAESWVL
jgi:hypothetical protein